MKNHLALNRQKLLNLKWLIDIMRFIPNSSYFDRHSRKTNIIECLPVENSPVRRDQYCTTFFLLNLHSLSHTYIPPAHPHTDARTFTHTRARLIHQGGGNSALLAIYVCIRFSRRLYVEVYIYLSVEREGKYICIHIYASNVARCQLSKIESSSQA